MILTTVFMGALLSAKKKPQREPLGKKEPRPQGTEVNRKSALHFRAELNMSQICQRKPKRNGTSMAQSHQDVRANSPALWIWPVATEIAILECTRHQPCNRRCGGLRCGCQ